jgi:hypothetical protein
MTQYTAMLSLLTNPPNLQFGEGMAATGETFEEALFYSLHKRRDVLSSMGSWSQSIPNYFTPNLFKAIKL